jgi:hypothetical protein
LATLPSLATLSYKHGDYQSISVASLLISMVTPILAGWALTKFVIASAILGSLTICDGSS